MGNICRSPAAEGVLNHLVRERGLEDRIHCDSAGTINEHTGNAPDKRMFAAARERGIRLGGAARQIQERDLHDFDLILTMDRENLEYVRRLVPKGDHAGKVRPFCEFLRKHDVTEVPDPYYGGSEGFTHVMELLEDGCEHIIEHALAER